MLTSQASTELAISALERCRQEGPWGSLASQPHLINEPQVPVRDPVSKEKEKTENKQARKGPCTR